MSFQQRDSDVCSLSVKELHVGWRVSLWRQKVKCIAGGAGKNPQTANVWTRSVGVSGRGQGSAVAPLTVLCSLRSPCLPACLALSARGHRSPVAETPRPSQAVQAFPGQCAGAAQRRHGSQQQHVAPELLSRLRTAELGEANRISASLLGFSPPPPPQLRTQANIRSTP